jgi:hypothetical protein
VRDIKYIVSIGVVALAVGVILSMTDPMLSVSMPSIPGWVVHVAVVAGLVVAGIIAILTLAAIVYVEKVLARNPVAAIYSGGRARRPRRRFKIPGLVKWCFPVIILVVIALGETIVWKYTGIWWLYLATAAVGVGTCFTISKMGGFNAKKKSVG